ncbi:MULTISPECIES: LysR family transcriptional regulator [Sphingomonadaceae]|jgi:DNA-binding transcriptional LysR family regulator|uniref:LysR family transcriptional regulator n=1 Tax=Novosphingobium resinovorum TaxID=158500 RepID=A0A031K359_9SPHN|nr:MULTISPECIES: LysR family transcriptional regulator [Sphingomonadaceae]EJU10330.1 LysR family transcriptional regulator [Sphingomonas sp. LH128]EZP84371.1 LysR family transcriptional regulator [Novosphingobium resinovorum]MBF7010750.1 LysR family transcriptional regulator [Novosphingobium sp. HR1a]WJM28747.1 LysR family transcriptional regulator [Novosphingobium resinovorum]GLK43355.1 LysR family transcriptional regulator [Novosphingobium resinovorum]
MPAFSRFLRYFMVVGRHGSIRKAADELNVSASAIARQILNVEAEIGTPLFERLPTGLRLTAAGEIMMAAGNRWQKNMQDIRAQIEDLRGLKRGHVDFAIIDALAKGYIPSVVRSVQERYPGITVGVKVQANDEVRKAVASGEVDFGILFEPHSYRDLTVRAFVEVVLGFITPPGHPLGELSEARFSAAIGEPLIVPAEVLAISQQIAVLEGTTGMDMSRIATSDNIQMIASLVQAGAGVGILSSLDVITEVQAGQVSFTRISDALLRPMTLALCTNSARTPSYAASLVLSEIENGFAGLSYVESMLSTEENDA